MFSVLTEWSFWIVIAILAVFFWFEHRSMDRQARENRSWTLRDGTKVSFDELETWEVRAIVAWLEGVAEEEQSQGYMAVNRLRPPLVIRHPKYPFLKAELERRRSLPDAKD